VITGSSDGIGKQFAIQLASHGFNVILIARTESKLKSVAEYIENKYKVKTKIIMFDFSNISDENYEILRRELKDLPIGILVNNVGISHEVPTNFMEESDSLLENMININILAAMKMTKIILPGMVQRKNGLIINMSSFSALVACPMLATYSGTKAFLLYWSKALAEELKSSGISIECLTPSFITTNLSKIRRSSLMVPTEANFVNSALRVAGKELCTSGYLPHALYAWILTYVPENWVTYFSYRIMKDIRKRYLRKTSSKKE